ncbi:hypothetical protein LCGC14_0217730 [marine sediment metagenome]|uniref:Collagen-like protein n=1 Tax=marine sediment metagenome TaxID=412755 RepID=A0A0F9UE21_9ZZZZ|nr:hypothetical protein [Maribacter sp.]HDZ04113.1 collagen-like protein [Maribacter sp.]HEA79840.1 collagen-like protein [Maribacter sp.]
MKTTMKLFTYALIILSLTITSCGKDGEDGAVGPAGTQGETGSDGLVGVDGADGTDGVDGSDGVDGTDGEDGNADVQVIEYESETITTGKVTYPMDGVSLNELNESLVLGFYAEVTQTPNAGNSFVTKKRWVPVPGRGTPTLFETRVIIEGSSALLSGGPSSDFIVNLYELGTLFAYLEEVIFDEFKIFVIPASSFSSPSSPVNSAKNSNDFSEMTYEELITHFDIEE